MENTLGTIVGYIVLFFVFSWLWSALILGITSLFDYTRDSDHRIKIDFKNDDS
jgi:hypothetical protein